MKKLILKCTLILTLVTIYIDADHFSKDENVTITILNTLGKTIKSVKLKTNQQGSLAANISLGTSLSKGLYIIKATTASGSFQKKLILN